MIDCNIKKTLTKRKESLFFPHERVVGYMVKSNVPGTITRLGSHNSPEKAAFVC